jgi:hypothetical protein
MLGPAIVLTTIAALVFIPAPAIGRAPGDPERGTLDGPLSKTCGAHQRPHQLRLSP